MDLTDYVKQQRRLLDKFEAHWEKRARQSPGMYPIEMDVPEWDEQFELWQNEQEESK